MSTVYPLDFLAKTLSGNGFQFQRRFTVAANATKYIVLDLSDLPANACVFGLPIETSLTSGHAHLDTYAAESCTMEEEWEVLPLNPKIGSTNNSIVGVCTSPVGKTSLREYSIGTESTRQNSGGGFTTNDTIKVLENKKIIFEYTNQENDEVSVALGYTWYECFN